MLFSGLNFDFRLSLSISHRKSFSTEPHEWPVVMDEEALLDADPLKEEHGSDSDEERDEDGTSGPSRLTPLAKAVLLTTAFVDIIGFSMPNPLMPYYYTHIVSEHGHDGLFLGLIMAAFSAGQFLGSLGAGAASDRIGRRIPILTCLVGNSICLVFSALAPSIGWLVVARGLAGLFAGTQSVCAAYVCDLTRREERIREMSHLQAAVSVGSLAGPAIGVAIGWSLGTERIETAFVLVCLLAAFIALGAAIAGLFVLHEIPRTTSPSASSPLNAIGPTMWRLLVQGDMRLILLAQFLLQTVGTIRGVSLPALLVTAQLAPIWQVLVVFGTLAAATPVVLAFGSPWASGRFGNRLTMVGGVLMNALGMVLIPLALVWYLVAPVTLLVACGSLVDPALQVVTSFLAQRAYGTALGLVRSVGAAARVAGPILGGVLFDAPLGCVPDNATMVASSSLCLLQTRNHVLPFWTGAAALIVSAVVCWSLKRADPVSSAPLANQDVELEELDEEDGF